MPKIAKNCEKNQNMLQIFKKISKKAKKLQK